MTEIEEQQQHHSDPGIVMSEVVIFSVEISEIKLNIKLIKHILINWILIGWGGRGHAMQINTHVMQYGWQPLSMIFAL